MIVPFQLQYTLTRRHRLPELLPWLPAIAGSLGFSIGVVVLAVDVTRWFLLLLLVPLICYRGVLVVIVDIIFRPRQAIEVNVDETILEILVGQNRRRLPLEGIFQVFRSADGSEWTVLHTDRSSLTIPTAAITEAQLEFLKSFARRAAAERKAAQRG